MNHRLVNSTMHISAFKYCKIRPYTRFFTFGNQHEPLSLQYGQTLYPITVAYETWGTLNRYRDNAILIEHTLTGCSHCASHGPEDDEGWWEPLVGPGKLFDTDRYFVVCSNVLGGCQGTTGPSSYAPSGEPYGASFPVITIGDMVKVQRELMKHLSIPCWHTVAGGSMGGMQALEWAVRYPSLVRSAIVIAAPLKASAQSIAYNEVARQAILSDPAWKGGQYYDSQGPVRGLSVARMLGMITYQSEKAMECKFGRELAAREPALTGIFEVENYLAYQGIKLVQRFDANSYLYLSRAIDLFDISAGRPSLESALGRITAKMLVVGISSDILYPSHQQKQMVSALRQSGVDASYVELVTDHGHDGFLIDFERIIPLLGEFMLQEPETMAAI